MRPIFWGSALTFVGIFLTIVLSKVLSGYGVYIVTGGPAIYNAPPFYMPLTYVVMFIIYLIYFSLPLAFAIEAYLFLKGRKGELKGEYVIDQTVAEEWDC